MTITPEQFAQLTLTQAKAGLESGDYTAEELVDASRARMDRFEPAINAIITRDDEAARNAARAADKTTADTALSGVPITIKDNIMTRGLRSTCGSALLENFVPPFNATVVEKLLASGAVVNGKANMDEFAMGATGENSAYGPTRNPWKTSLVTGGSSSGSAGVVAYGGALAALGSDTGGSIRLPAAFCGLVGMRPTYGRVSRYGVGALASSLDQVGPITRTVEDNALLMDILSGHDHRDSTSARQADTALPCLPAINQGIGDLRIGYDPSLLNREGVHPNIAKAMGTAIEHLRESGVTTKEVTVPLINYTVAAYYILCSCEASANMARFDGIRYGKRRGTGELWDIYSDTRGEGFSDEVKRRIMMGSYALSKGYYDAYYLKAARVRRLLALEMAKLFHEVDVLVMPVTPTPPRAVGTKTTVLEEYLGDIFSLPASLAGLPALSYPVGVFDDLPAGVQIIAGPFREDLLYRVARVSEQKTTLDNAPWTRATPEEAK